MIKSVEDPYIMIPNIIVQNIKHGEEVVEFSYVRLFGKKAVVYLRQLLELQNIKGYSYFSTNMIMWMSKIKNNMQREKKYFKEFLMKLKESSLIVCTDDIDNISANDFISVKMDIYKHKENGKIKNYFKLMDSEFNTIMDDYSGKLDKINLLNLFCNLKSRIRRNAVGVLPLDRQPEVCYPSYETIKHDISIESDKSLKLYINALVELDLIQYDYAGDMIITSNDQTIIRKANFIYVMVAQGWEDELSKGVSQFKKGKEKDGWYFMPKEKEISANEKRSITQKINILEKLAKQTTISQFQKEELAKLKQEKEKWSCTTKVNVPKLEVQKLIGGHADQPFSEHLNILKMCI